MSYLIIIEFSDYFFIRGIAYSLHSISHQGCKCPPEFEGEHCEYVKGTAPKMVNESDSGRKVANETAFEYSTDITEEHTKKSEELPASSDTGSFMVQNAESGGFETSTNAMQEIIIPPSET